MQSSTNELLNTTTNLNAKILVEIGTKLMIERIIDRVILTH